MLNHFQNLQDGYNMQVISTRENGVGRKLYKSMETGFMCWFKRVRASRRVGPDLWIIGVLEKR